MKEKIIINFHVTGACLAPGDEVTMPATTCGGTVTHWRVLEIKQDGSVDMRPMTRLELVWRWLRRKCGKHINADVTTD